MKDMTRLITYNWSQVRRSAALGLDREARARTGVTFGVTGGYVDSTLEFKDKADSAHYKGLNLGAYAGAQRGRVFVNALAKYDLIDIQARSTTAGYDEDLDGRGYGLQVETGARFNRQIAT
jgi:outer membrane autotransporter protein